MSWANNAKRLMKEKGVLQKDLVLVLGVKESQVAHYFSGRNDITLGKFLALAKHLGAEPQDLIDLDLPSVETLQREIQSVPMRDLVHLQAMIRSFSRGASWDRKTERRQLWDKKTERRRRRIHVVR